MSGGFRPQALSTALVAVMMRKDLGAASFTWNFVQIRDDICNKWHSALPECFAALSSRTELACIYVRERQMSLQPERRHVLEYDFWLNPMAAMHIMCQGAEPSSPCGLRALPLASRLAIGAPFTRLFSTLPRITPCGPEIFPVTRWLDNCG